MKPHYSGWFKGIVKLYHNLQKLREANKISAHFSQYFAPVLATSVDETYAVHRIRHQVYCEELSFEPLNEAQQERDEFDDYALFCLLQHTTSEAFAGTVRVVYPTHENQQLPIQKYCSSSITNKALHPDNQPLGSICEISRLAVPAEFRRRSTDRFNGAATGAINLRHFSQDELRCFPFIAVGLYLAAAATVINENIAHTYVMMEPRLARSMSFVGIKFEQLGPVVDYHGKRAPYYINPHLFLANLTPGFRVMFEHIASQLAEQRDTRVPSLASGL